MSHHHHHTRRSLLRCTALLGAALVIGCSPVTIGRPFRVNPYKAIKVGHDSRKDILNKMGNPYRKNVDAKGREIFTYVWADGKGNGRKCVILFNKNNLVALVEVVP